jgi:hypothetical protein
MKLSRLLCLLIRVFSWFHLIYHRYHGSAGIKAALSGSQHMIPHQLWFFNWPIS